jgi:hypothetical protein
MCLSLCVSLMGPSPSYSYFSLSASLDSPDSLLPVFKKG